MTQLITNSRLTAYRTCPQLHHILYVLGYRPVEKARPLEWGDLMHVLLEAWWQSWLDGNDGKQLARALWKLNELTCTEFDRAAAGVIITAYDLRWAEHMSDYEVLAVEQTFNYDSGRGYNLAGKIDGIVKHRPTGRTLILEHKNTSADFGPADSYWTKLRMEPQVGQYFRGAQALGYNPTGCLWDVLRRPEIKPLQATPVEKREYCKTGPRKGQLHKGQRLTDETPEEYGQRVADLIAEDPDSWFARREVVRLPEELARFDRDVTYFADKAVADSDEFATPGRNPDACRRDGRLCDMWAVCSGSGSLSDESKYRKTYNDGHEELAA